MPEIQKMKFTGKDVPQSLKPEGKAGIQKLGHRGYVGGLWDELGKLQFDFLINQGLKPEHCLLDIACGSLRAGRFFIEHLNPGNYLGLDKEQELIDLGLQNEIEKGVLETKKPEFVVSDTFEFEKFSKIADFSLAQSLFTHLNAGDILVCLNKLRKYAGSNHTLYATFFEGDSKNNPPHSHSHACFYYPKDLIIRLGRNNGWEVFYIGDWNHPRDQKMAKFVAF
jgi:SAM-dependent methyltransferase